MGPMAWVWGALVTVVGTTTCPTPEAVQEELTHLLAPAAAMDRAELNMRKAGPTLELLGPSGEPLASRVLEQRGGCQDLAKAAAVILATWEMELRPGVAQSVQLPKEAE